MSNPRPQMRQHIITDMSGHIAGELITAFRRHVTQLYRAGVTPTEGMAISAIVAKQFSIAAIGGAALLSGCDDKSMIFSQLLRAMVDDINLARESIAAELGKVAEGTYNV